MKKLIIGLILIILLLPFASCGTTATGPEVEKETPPMTVEEGKELDIESWEIGENWMYSQQSIWGDIMVGLETEWQQGKAVKQYIGTYNLRSREKELVYELPPERVADQAPAIHGSNIVWSSAGDVFLLDLKTTNVQQLTSEEHAQVNPRIFEDTVVWQDARNREGYYNPQRFDVYAYDIKTKTEKRLTSAPTAEGDLSIDGKLVVWTDNRHADPPMDIHAGNEPGFNNEIYAYDLTTNEEMRVTNYPGNDRHPVIDGDNIVWLRQLHQDYIKADVFLYNTVTGKEIQISTSNYAAFNPDTNGNLIVWTDARATEGNTTNDVVMNGQEPGADIYLYDLETRQETKLTTTEKWKVWHKPVIHDSFVVYEWSRMIGPIAYAARLDG